MPKRFSFLTPTFFINGSHFFFLGKKEIALYFLFFVAFIT